MSRARSSPLRVLVVAGREPWPLNSGGRLRLFNFLHWLAQSERVSLALPSAARHAKHLPAGLRLVDMSAAANRACRVPRNVPLVARLARRHFGCDPAIVDWLSNYAHTGNYDVALLYGAVTGVYAGALRVPIVWDVVDELVLYTARDTEWRGMRHWWRAARAAALHAAFERHGARQARATILASTVDASYARRWAGATRIETITNGVDTTYFHNRVPEPERDTVAFVGSLNFPPNVEAALRFVTRIWPRVLAERPNGRLLIVGREPVAEVRELARLPGVELHADVPDVRPYMARATTLVVPTRLGGGVKNKVLEACALGRPVVASPRALAGLSARRGSEVLCAGDEAVWVRHVSRLLEEPARARAIGARGHAWVCRAHSWPVLAGHVAQLLRAASGGQRERRPVEPAKCCELPHYDSRVATMLGPLQEEPCLR